MKSMAATRWRVGRRSSGTSRKLSTSSLNRSRPLASSTSFRIWITTGPGRKFNDLRTILAQADFRMGDSPLHSQRLMGGNHQGRNRRRQILPTRLEKAVQVRDQPPRSKVPDRGRFCVTATILTPDLGHHTFDTDFRAIDIASTNVSSMIALLVRTCFSPAYLAADSREQCLLVSASTTPMLPASFLGLTPPETDFHRAAATISASGSGRAMRRERSTRRVGDAGAIRLGRLYLAVSSLLPRNPKRADSKATAST